MEQLLWKATDEVILRARLIEGMTPREIRERNDDVLTLLPLLRHLFEVEFAARRKLRSKGNTPFPPAQ